VLVFLLLLGVASRPLEEKHIHPGLYLGSSIRAGPGLTGAGEVASRAGGKIIR